MKNTIDYNTMVAALNTLEIKIGKIIDVMFVPKNKRMVKLIVDFGNNDVRIVITNMGGDLEDIMVLKDKNMQFVTNLEPAVMNGFLSSAMILPAKLSEHGVKPVVYDLTYNVIGATVV